MQSKTVGQLLQAEREYLDIDIETVAQALHIKITHLDALEDNAFEQLPAAPFVKGYIVRYAEFLGLDAEPLLALLRRDFKKSAKGTLVPREFVNPMLESKRRWNRASFAFLGAVVVFLTLIGYVVAQWISLQQPPYLEIQQPEENQQVAAQIEVVGKTDPDVELTVNAQPVSLQPNGRFETEVFIPRQGVTTITVQATDSRGKTQTVQRTVTVSF